MPPAPRFPYNCPSSPGPLGLPVLGVSYDAGACVRGFLPSAVFEVHACCPGVGRLWPSAAAHAHSGWTCYLVSTAGLRGPFPPLAGCWLGVMSGSTGAQAPAEAGLCATGAPWEPQGPQQSPRCLGSSCRPSLAPFSLPWPPVPGTQDQNQEGRAPTSLGSKAVLGSDLGRMFRTHRGSGVFLLAPVLSMAMTTQDSLSQSGFLLGPHCPREQCVRLPRRPPGVAELGCLGQGPGSGLQVNAGSGHLDQRPVLGTAMPLTGREGALRPFPGEGGGRAHLPRAGQGTQVREAPARVLAPRPRPPSWPR